MRAARLYKAPDPTLTFSWLDEVHVRINVRFVASAFIATMEFRKPLYDDLSRETSPAVTWQRTETGTHGGDVTYVVQAVSENLDTFVLEYLRANEDACE